MSTAVAPKTKRKPRPEKADDRINRLYLARCEGVQVPMMKIPTIFAVGRKAIAEGADDAALGDALAAYVETIRHN